MSDGNILVLDRDSLIVEDCNELDEVFVDAVVICLVGTAEGMPRPPEPGDSNQTWE